MSYTPYYKRKRKRILKGKNKKHLALRILLGVLIVILALTAGVAGAYYYLRSSGKAGLRQNAKTAVPDLTKSDTLAESNEEQEDYDPTVFRYDGVEYKYNSNIITILCMGIDKNTENVELQEISGESGQADSIFLLVIDPTLNKVKIISVSRDTMTEIKNYDVTGKEVGESVNHLGLAYAYGDGGEKSCELMVDAVSNLFYDLPIHGYVSLLMSAIGPINDAVGGVTVTVPDDLSDKDPALYEGATVTLMGDQAEVFVRTRDTEAEGSNNLRMARQKTYALGFINAAKAALKQNPSLTIELYNEFSKQMVTNIGLDNAVYLASEIAGMEFDLDDILTIEGTTKQGAVYEEFYVDDEALLQLVLDTFYTEVPEV